MPLKNHCTYRKHGANISLSVQTFTEQTLIDKKVMSYLQSANTELSLAEK
jgi:hypothetical protein